MLLSMDTLRTRRLPALLAGVAGLFLVTADAQARDQIRIVGSSTVFPFATSVAENFGRAGDHKTPVVESTGSGGGLKLFCAGKGVAHPDITNASRRIKKSEVAKCAENGINDIVEMKIGYDGIVIANARTAPPMELTLEQLFRALAARVPGADGALIDNPYRKWSEIDPALPDSEIEVLGPPPTSGTRDAFIEIAMEKGARAIPALADLRKADKSAFKGVAHALREDGAWIDAGENDNLIVQKLAANPAAFGVFGFSFLDQNADSMQGATVDGVEPTFEAIADGDYPVSRSLWFYVKKDHVGVIPGIADYLREFTSDEAWGEDGYLAEKGLIPMPAEERAKYRADSTNLTPLMM